MIKYQVDVIEDKKLFSKTATVIFDEREDSANREKWLSIRKKSIGGSEIGAIAGFNKYASALTVFNDKLDLVEGFKGNVFTKNGTRLEPFIRYYVQEDFEEATGIKLTTFEYPFMMIDNEIPCLSANIDGLGKLDLEYRFYENRDTGEFKSIPAGELFGLEIKTGSEFTSGSWDGEEIPDSYLTQVYHYMGVTGLNYFLIIYKLGAEIKWKVIPRNDDDIKALRNIGHDFWTQHILTKVAPEPTGLKVETDQIKEQQDLSNNDEVSITDEKLSQYNEVSEKIKDLETEKERLKQEIFLELGNSKKGTDGSYKLSRYTVSRDKLDNKMLKEIYPLTYEAVKNGTTEFITMRVTKCK